MNIQEAKELFIEHKRRNEEERSKELQILITKIDRSLRQVISNGHCSLIVYNKEFVETRISMDQVIKYYQSQNFLVKKVDASAWPDIEIYGWAQ